MKNKHSQQGIIILYSGPSGVGKDTLRVIFQKNTHLNIGYSISYTTRERRGREVEGKDYFFVSKTSFQKMIDNQEFAEWAEFAGNFYGTSKKQIAQVLAKGQNVLLQIEVEGAKQILKIYPDCLSIFLVPPSLQELKKRLQRRSTESPQLIKKRLKKAQKEMEQKQLYKYVVINDHSFQAAQKIVEIILDNISK